MANVSLTKLLVGSIQDLPVRVGKTVNVGHKEIAVFRLSDSNIRAVENRCPHKGGVLTEGIVSGNSVFCPMHDWKICLEDGEVQEPDTGCVKTYKTEVEEDKIYLLLEGS